MDLHEIKIMKRTMRAEKRIGLGNSQMMSRILLVSVQKSQSTEF